MASLGVGSRAMAISFFAILAVLVQSTNAAVYKVGDSAGWTTIGNVDYKHWAATKTFQVGDVIVFQYSPEHHNVMQVTHAEFRACNVSSPIATFTTGNDSITITSPRHHFFICGVPGHCESGQKVDINARRSADRTPTSTPAPDAASEVPAPAPSNAPSSAAPRREINRIYVKAMMALALVYVGVVV